MYEWNASLLLSQTLFCPNFITVSSCDLPTVNLESMYFTTDFKENLRRLLYSTQRHIIHSLLFCVLSCYCECNAFLLFAMNVLNLLFKFFLI